MTLPNVLIIGAMKSGTTGLYLDLATHPNVFLAQDKEPQNLCSDEVLTQQGRQKYAQQYAGAHSSQVICDASTNYAKRPDYDGVVRRALEVLPAGFKVIYMVRHPVDRILSQHYHEFIDGTVSGAVNDDVRRHSRFLDYSSYAYQLQPWLDAIGQERIKIVRFEDYVAQRREVVQEVGEFLGLSRHGYNIRLERIYNQSMSKPVATSFWKRVASNSVYKNLLRRLLPPQLRLAIYRWILPAAPEKPAGPPLAMLDWLHESLGAEVHQLSKMLGLSEPLWSDFIKAEEPAHPRSQYVNKNSPASVG